MVVTGRQHGEGVIMAVNQDDYQDFVDQRRFLGEIEHGIRLANRRIIHERIPSLNKETIHSLAVAVGRLRARYLVSAFNLGVNESGDPPDQAEIIDLRTRREMFEEARSAFDALREAIEKGYVDIEKVGDA
jgi:hypothetical protein